MQKQRQEKTKRTWETATRKEAVKHGARARF